MLVVFFKSIFTFFLVLLVLRLMGKRELGEMQPFELVITLIIAEVACIPMNDPYIPFFYGIIPIVTLAVLHVLFSFLARKSMTVRKLLSGRSIMAIDRGTICYNNLKKMNMNVNDLLDSVHSSGYSDLMEIEYAIFETNGKLCIVEKPSDPQEVKPAYLPLSLVIDGKTLSENVTLAGVTENEISAMLKKNGVKSLKDALYADVRQDGTVYVSPKKNGAFTAKMKIRGGQNW